MTIDELKDEEITSGIAYVLGLIYPLYKTGKNNQGRNFIKGCINYNKISDEDLAEHFKIVLNFLDDINIDLKANKQPYYSISPKKGFSALIWKEDKKDEICRGILTNKVREIKESNDIEIKKSFAKGCFDGRSSFDTTMHFLALDVDRDREYEQQNLIKAIFDDLQIDLNLNRRDINHSKNDQIRIKPAYLSKFITEIDLFSKTRKDDVINYIINRF